MVVQTLMWRWLSVLLLISYFFVLGTERAKTKPFWGDEDYEIWSNCSYSYSKLIHGNADGQSTTPLYYLVQKAVCSHVSDYGENILVEYRYVAIFSGIALVCAFFLFLSNWFGILFAWFGVAVLTQREIFQNYLSENRPYMMWLLLFTVCSMIAIRLSKRGTWDSKSVIGLFLSGLMLTLVAGPGMMQAAAACLSVPLYWRVTKKNLSKSHLLQFLGAALVFLAIGYFYGVKSASTTPGTAGWSVGAWDLVDSPWNRKIEMVTLVLDLLVSFQGIHNILFSALFLIGLVIPIRVFFQSRSGHVRFPSYLENRSELVLAMQALVWQVLVQFGVALVSAVLIAHYHYFFIQRVFIYLVTCKALVVVCGAVISFYWIHARLSGWFDGYRTRLPVQKAAWAFVFIAMLAGVSAKHYKFYEFNKNLLKTFRSTYADSRQCPEFHGTVIPMMPKDMSLDHHGANFVVETSREISRCGRKGSEGFTFVRPIVPTYGKSFKGLSYMEHRIDVEVIPANDLSNYSSIIHCGKDVSFPVRGG